MTLYNTKKLIHKIAANTMTRIQESIVNFFFQTMLGI